VAGCSGTAEAVPFPKPFVPPTIGLSKKSFGLSEREHPSKRIIFLRGVATTVFAFAICYNPVGMIDTVLVPAKTVVSAKGDGPSVDVSGASNRVFLVTLAITKIIEQESLDLSIFGSADGATWDAKSIAAFPQKFYCGESPLLLDLRAHPEVKFVRAHWEVARWGRGTETPTFEFGATMKEVSAEILKEVMAEARTA
jgi:hypothetical protein